MLAVALAKRSPYLTNKNRVSGLLLANHTSIAKLFQKQAAQFDKLRARNAFLDHYTKHDMFKGEHSAAGSPLFSFSLRKRRPAGDG